MIRAVIFNLDGVLVSTDECHYIAWRSLAYEQGLSMTPELYRALAGRKRMDSLKTLLQKAERSYSPAEMWALSARKNDLFNELIDNLGPDSVLPGAVETVKQLRDWGIKTAVASSSENAGGILRQLNINKLFHVIVDGGDIERGKPDPEAFHLAARRLLTPTRECLVIESTEAGMKAAKDAGMRAVMVEGSVKEIASGKYPFLNELDFSLLLDDRAPGGEKEKSAFSSGGSVEINI